MLSGGAPLQRTHARMQPTGQFEQRAVRETLGARQRRLGAIRRHAVQADGRHVCRHAACRDMSARELSISAASSDPPSSRQHMACVHVITISSRGDAHRHQRMRVSTRSALACILCWNLFILQNGTNFVANGGGISVRFFEGATR